MSVVTGMDLIRQAREQSMQSHAEAMLKARKDGYRNGLPRLVIDARLSQFEARNKADQAVLAAARQWLEACVDGSPNNLVLIGPNGTGKTWLMVAMGWALLPSTRPAVYVSAPDLWADVKHSYGDNSAADELQILSRYVSAPVLLLDEVGAGHVTEAYRACIAGLICKRANAGLPTVAASNLSADKWADALDGRAADRLAGGIVLPVLGASRRGAA